MARKKISEEIIREHLRLSTAEEIVISDYLKENGISQSTYYKWRKKYRETKIPDFFEVKYPNDKTKTTSEIRIEIGRCNIFLNSEMNDAKISEIVRALS